MNTKAQSNCTLALNTKRSPRIETEIAASNFRETSDKMEFNDLSDQIEADNWLVPKAEITRRKLIKQTPRYRIYKADWFGDVLLYEPVEKFAGNRQDLAHRRHRHQQQRQRPPPANSTQIDLQVLSARIEQLKLLNLEIDPKAQSDCAQILSPPPRLASCESPAESAYSSGSTTSCSSETNSIYSSRAGSACTSISSTPQYDTKQVKCKFEFTSVPSPSVHCESLSVPLDPPQPSIAAVCSPVSNKRTANRRKAPPVVLNRGSFEFGASQFPVETTSEDNSTNSATGGTGNDNQEYNLYCSESENWFELNELRLVAHESFMLFMGASVDTAMATLLENDREQQTAASLVMEMSSPKATSLFDLLHANHSNSFFAGKHYRPLGLEAKLNICQQVTDAMTYLHDKNIVHGKLTSVNIYIEPNQRVKISLIDNDEQAIANPVGHRIGQKHHHRDQLVSLNLPALTYLSPELIRTLRVNNCDKNQPDTAVGSTSTEVHFNTDRLTKESDVFAFGTLLYELFEERLPFAGNSTSSGNIKASASELIFQIGSGQIGAVNSPKRKCPTLVDKIIIDCWSLEPWERPRFKQLTFI